MKERSARDWKVRSTKVDAGDFKHELLNRLRSTMAVNVLKDMFCRRHILDVIIQIILSDKNELCSLKGFACNNLYVPYSWSNRLYFRFVLTKSGKPVIIRLITCANYAVIHAPDKIEDWKLIHYVVCLATGLQPLPKRVSHRNRSSAASFKFRYLLFHLSYTVAAYFLFLVSPPLI